MSKMKFSAIGPHHDTVQFDIVAMVSSAGGLAAVRHVLEHLPAAFPAAIVIVQHLDPRHRSLMAGILSHHTQLAVKEAEEGDRLAPGHVYLAPPNRHLLVNPDRTLSLSQSYSVPRCYTVLFTARWFGGTGRNRTPCATRSARC